MRRGAIVLAALLALSACGGGGVTTITRGDPTAGASGYATHCASCHGEAGKGTAEGPSLRDERLVGPGYSDTALARAIREGVDTDLTDFPPMPLLPGLSNEEIGDIVAFVRSLQGAPS